MCECVETNRHIVKQIDKQTECENDGGKESESEFQDKRK